MKKLSLILFLLSQSLIYSPVTAQFPHILKIKFTLPGKEPVFTCGIQDRNGYIFLGSSEGLYRFDGESFVKVSPSDMTDDLNVSAIHQAPDGTIWAGCRDGKIFILDRDALQPFQPEEGMPGKGISDIITDRDGRTWWSTLGEGIYFMEAGRVFNINQEDGLPENYVYDLEPAPDGSVWAGTDGGVARCRRDEGQKIIQTPEFNRKLPDVIVRVVRFDPQGRIWLGFHDAEPGYNTPGQPEAFISSGPGDWSYGPVSDLVFTGNEAWVATLEGGLFEMSSQGTLLIDPELLKIGVGKIHDLLEDREGNIWILANTGLYQSTGSKFLFYEQLEQGHIGNVHAIQADRKDGGRKLFFSNDDGCYSADLLTGIIKKLNIDGLDEAKVTSLLEDERGYVWAGTFNQGVFRTDPVRGTSIRITEREGLVNNNVLSISGHLDTLWLATLGGATEIVISGDQLTGPFGIRSFNRSNGLVSNYIYSVFEDRQNSIWFATDGDGVSVFDHGKFRNIGLAEGLADDVIYSVTGDQYGNIWIATANAGIYRYDNKGFRHFGPDEGLSGLDISGMITSGDEVIVVMDDGLDIIHIPSGAIVNYGESSGLAGIAPDLNVISADERGNVWIGTKKGIVRYRPGSKASTGPETVLEEMMVFLEPVGMRASMKLNSGDNHISFRYSGLWFTNPGKVSYQVMLEGYDLGWKNTFDRSATYSSLPPGEYTFRVRSAAGNVFLQAPEASFTFRIRQPFWMSPWFIGLIIISLALITYFVMRLREKKLRNQELAKKEKLEFEFQVLKNQINPHFLFNSFSTLISLIEDQPHEAVQYTEKLSDFFRTILQLKDQEIIPMEEELTIADRYFFLIRKRFGENISLDINLDPNALNSYIPPMTLQILLENAVKHNIISKDKPLAVKIFSEVNHIIVENNLQPKKTAEASTGIGLENITRRYQLKTDQKPAMQKTDSHFRVILPVITG